MKQHEPLSEKESLNIINEMIQKTKVNYHERGISALLWGTVVTIAGIVSYFQFEYNFKLKIDIWLLVLAAIIPQIFISIHEKKTIKVRRHIDEAIDAVWIVYALTIFGLVAYQNLMPGATLNIIHENGWEMIKHFTDGSKPDEIMKPFAPSISSLYILIYAFPTMITGIATKFKPMIIGACISYIFFILSLYTESKYDMLFNAGSAIVNWLIPGIILQRRYLKNIPCNV
ncbi:MAG: hypothetical protein KGZ59_08420 [Chitinophagaceae bacterium]|nr:hypothetical protein [Chitinophagaceae bacterium]